MESLDAGARQVPAALHTAIQSLRSATDSCNRRESRQARGRRGFQALRPDGACLPAT